MDHSPECVRPEAVIQANGWPAENQPSEVGCLGPYRREAIRSSVTFSLWAQANAQAGVGGIAKHSAVVGLEGPVTLITSIFPALSTSCPSS